MSHMVAVDVEVRDLDALEQAAERIGLELVRNQKTFRWYGTWVNDYHAQDAAYKHGTDPKDYGKCEHALVIPGRPGAYEIGVIKNPQGAGYKLVWDFWDGALRPLIGQEAEKLKQAYAVSAARRVAHKHRHTIIETTLPDGSIKLTMRIAKKGG